MKVAIPAAPISVGTRTLTMVDGVKVVVPDSLDLITPYVLEEQGDWFEDEIGFVRHVLCLGDHVIDIGANHGVYSLSMAQAVGAGGMVAGSMQNAESGS